MKEQTKCYCGHTTTCDCGPEEPKQDYEYIGECNGNNDNGCFMNSSGQDCGCFIRVPKEEPKQEIDMSKYIVGIDPYDKQETLEEVAERFYREFPNNPKDKPDWHYNKDIHCFKKRKAFISGAKWQAERSYSEEEVKNLLNKRMLSVGIFSSEKATDIWFKQYTKTI